jgi:hypothetical protein
MIWGALLGGFAGTVVLTTALRAATELGWTRMDLPFLLGTALCTDRIAAKAVGYALHFVFGLSFASLYGVVFAITGASGVIFGALLGFVHALFAGAALVNVLLPLVHPRMGTGFESIDSAPLLEPPGFMLRNYGVQTPLATVVSHVLYGVIVGGFAAAAA